MFFNAHNFPACCEMNGLEVAFHVQLNVVDDIFFFGNKLNGNDDDESNHVAHKKSFSSLKVATQNDDIESFQGGYNFCTSHQNIFDKSPREKS
ncbi:CLUMA_CG000891, isoform A [Clunio marinus]|uniref:CLUMA_CG000891, isoform A n=1 Tax=Clunio marinus TaxID=568069 RepID=A0A1J1HGM6_9DIPT|nr:CLUMA_CG000891, isoform A [Clunio marinus]